LLEHGEHLAEEAKESGVITGKINPARLTPKVIRDGLSPSVEGVGIEAEKPKPGDR
jgi:hypothetical protein